MTKKTVKETIKESEIKVKETVDTKNSTPKAKATAKKNSEITKAAKAVMELGILSQEVIEGIEAIEESKKLAQAGLQEIFQIEANLYTLDATLNAIAEAKSEFDALDEEKKNMLDALKKEYETKKADLQAEHDQLREDLETKRIREDADAKYLKSVEDREADDLRKEEIAKEKKALDEREAKLDAREAEIKEKDTLISELQKQIEEFPTLLENAKKEAFELGKKDAGKDYGIEKARLNGEKATAEALSKAKIEMLEANLERVSKENEQLRADINGAYDKIESIANKASESAANARMVQSYESALKDSSSKK